MPIMVVDYFRSNHLIMKNDSLFTLYKNLFYVKNRQIMNCAISTAYKEKRFPLWTSFALPSL